MLENEIRKRNRLVLEAAVISKQKVEKMDTENNEWELSKENIQPLRSGRDFASLSAALQPITTDQGITLIKSQKQ